MKHGFIKAAAVTPEIRVADTGHNTEVICEGLEKAYQQGAKIIVFPELCITGYTCGDLFTQDILLEKAKSALLVIAEATRGKDALVMVGLPFERDGSLYNVAAVLHNGEILGMIPKVNIPSYAEFYEGRHFVQGNRCPVKVWLEEKEIPFGANLLFKCKNVQGLTVGCEICEDLWAVSSPGTDHALNGATVLANLSASNETIGKSDYRRILVQAASGRLLCGYIYCSSGEGESTQDVVFGGHKLIGENGRLLAETEHFLGESVYADIDVQRIVSERRREGSFVGKEEEEQYTVISFELNLAETKLCRSFSGMPFVPSDEEKKKKRCEEILSIQAYGLKQRYKHTGSKTAVLGISGGLDSTLALLVTVRAFDLLGLDRKGIIAVTMPGFGTTDRTYDNACSLTKILGASLREISICEAVTVHFRDIGHEADKHDVTYENSQARERTQILMDIANQVNGMVIGTGDMSELALGWATYNGDHMSMYGVNSGVPKTLVRHLVKYYADTCGEKTLSELLLDILDTPVSPELLPPVNGMIAQKTEDLVGPYELHDFFLYYVLRCSFPPQKVYRVAREAFRGSYEDAVILKWLKVFYKRFFTQQFKRSCLPDGPKVGSVALSPRGDWRMPTDACMRIWLEELETLE